MKLKILRVEDHGTLQSERVFLSVEEDANLMYYLIRDTTYTSDDKISNKWDHIYKFLGKSVKAGDEVVLYTATAPKESEKINNNKNTCYYFSWGLKECVWNNDGDVAVLYEISNWQSSPVKPVK